MPIRAIRLCHHCSVALSEDDVATYVFECHVCVMAEHDLETAVRRDPKHLDASRLKLRPVLIGGRPRRRRAAA